CREASARCRKGFVSAAPGRENHGRRWTLVAGRRNDVTRTGGDNDVLYPRHFFGGFGAAHVDNASRFGKRITLDYRLLALRLHLRHGDIFAERDANGAADEINTCVERDFTGAEESAGKSRRELDHIRLALVH